jgi:hypothetical protein
MHKKIKKAPVVNNCFAISDKFLFFLYLKTNTIGKVQLMHNAK